MNAAVTPPEILTRRKQKGWKPNTLGQLVFKPTGLAGRGYVVETDEQLDRIEKYERMKRTLMVIVGGAVIGVALSLQADASEGETIGRLVVVLALVAGLLGYSLMGGSRIARDTAMRRSL